MHHITPKTWDETTARDIQSFCEQMAEAADSIRDQQRQIGNQHIADRAHARGQAFWTVRNMIEDALFEDKDDDVS